MSPQPHSEPQTLTGYLRIIRRRKWAVAQMLLLGPLVALLISLHQTPAYEASAGVLLSLQPTTNVAQAGPVTPEDPARVVQNQAQIARALPVVRRVVRATGNAFPNASALLANSQVSTDVGVDLLTFSVTHRSPAAAIGLANEYARQFLVYLQNFETSSVTRALKQVNQRIASMKERGVRGRLYAALQAKQQELETLETLETPTASLVHSATAAAKVKPRVVRNVLLGIGLGLLIGLGTAFLWEALDSRIRSEEEVGELLGLPLLGRTREAPRRLGTTLSMLHAPESAHAESFRTLRIALETVSRRIGAKSIMVTSAVDGEGRSSTVANLAVAQARAGRRVVLVDFDLRYPSLDRLFGLEGRPGLTDVVLGHTSLEEAMAEIPIGHPIGIQDNPPDQAPTNGSTRSGRSFGGSLRVLTAGPVSPDLRELLVTPVVAELLEQLHGQADAVLVDAPPIVPVGDAQALAAHVDALLVVVKFSFVRRRLLNELRRTLEMSTAPPLGFVLIESEGEEQEAYSGFYRPRRLRPLPKVTVP
jgi:Mrp family chromosome partitioning ATPase/capsular polysaccharide biosynthesis protein